MNIFDLAGQHIREHRRFVLATVIKTTGSTPRHVGAKMIIYPDGSSCGTIGGGTFERMVIDDANHLFTSTTKAVVKHYSFSREGADSTGMCCGGNVDLFLELHTGMKKLVLFGGGHVGSAIAKLAVESDFSVTVVDDRSDILSQLPESVEKIQTDQEYEMNVPEINEHTYIVIVTRSHPIDYQLLKKYARCRLKYLGMIGSKAKVAKMFKALQEEGVEKAMLDNIHAPIGININAEGPFEIALSIMGQLIAVKNER